MSCGQQISIQRAINQTSLDKESYHLITALVLFVCYMNIKFEVFPCNCIEVMVRTNFSNKLFEPRAITQVSLDVELWNLVTTLPLI